MGYSTEFDGAITITPPLPPELRAKLNEFCDEDHRDGTTPGYWCDLQFAADGASFGWNGSEKTYYLTEWVQYIIDHFLKPAGHVANGQLRASGEESGDLWTLVVEDNVASERRAQITW